MVEVHATCCDGPHLIHRGTWALFWPWRRDLARMVRCEQHANAMNIFRPVRSFTMVDDVEDVKANQVGDEG